MGLSHLKGVTSEKVTLKTLWKMGLGSVSIKTMIGFGRGGWSYDNSIIGMVLLANLPQVVLVFLDWGYSGLWSVSVFSPFFCFFQLSCKSTLKAI